MLLGAAERFGDLRQAWSLADYQTSEVPQGSRTPIVFLLRGAKSLPSYSNSAGN